MKIFSMKGSVIYSWILSFLLVLSIPIIFAVIIYFQTEKVIENEINKSNTFQLNQVQQRIDGLLVYLNKVSMEVIFNDTIQGTLKSNTDAIDGYTLYKAITTLKQYEFIAGYSVKLYLYLKNNDLVLSQVAGLDSKEFYTSNYSDNDIAYKEWLKLLHERYYGQYLFLSEDTEKNVHDKDLTYLRTIPMTDSSESGGTLMIKIQQSQFVNDAIDINPAYEGSVLILDTDNNIIASTNPTNDLSGIRYEDLPGKQGMRLLTIDHKKMAVSYIASEAINWKYVIVVPQSIFWEKANQVRTSAIVYLLLCLLVAGVITMFLIKKNYNPLIRLVKNFEEQNRNLKNKGYNEYEYIETALKNEFNKRSELDQRINMQNKAMRSAYTAKLLRGKSTLSEIEKDITVEHDIIFESQDFAVMAYYIERVDEELQDKEDPEKGYELVRFIFENIIGELVGKNNIAYFTELDDLVVCLVNFKQNGVDTWKEELRRINLEAEGFIKKYYNIEYMVSISSVHETIADISKAYDEALHAIQYKRFLEIRELFFYDEIVKLPKGDYYYPMEKEMQLLNFIKIGDAKQAKEVLEVIYSNNFDSTYLSMQMATCLMFDLVSTMIKALNGLDEKSRDSFLKDLGPVELVLNCKTIHEMKNRIQIVVEKFCDYIEDKNTSLVLRNKITDHINDHYNDFNLSVTSIAEHMGMHPVYISKKFKECGNIGLAEWINKVRVEKAKELLTYRKSNIDDIAKEVGFANVRTFTRAFAKIEGVTPGKFREDGTQ